MANVHKDFHGAMSFGIQFVIDNYGMDGLRKYLCGLADTMYAPLVEGIKERGLPALREHWESIFSLEEGEFEIREEEGALILDVKRCPAIAHMQEHGYAIAPQFCEHTRILNEAICAKAGYEASVDYDQEAGCCIQRFWKAWTPGCE